MLNNIDSSSQRCRDAGLKIKALSAGLMLAGACVLSQVAFAGDSAPTAACDPYKDYSCLDKNLGTGFWERMSNYYSLEMGQAAAPADPKAPASRRDDFPPAAQTIPPMPFSEWPYGGTIALGSSLPGAADSPLMVGLANTSFGKWMSNNNIQTYGWIDVGYNVSTNSVRGGNSPAAYDYNPNAFDLNQIVEYFERVPDTVQKDHTDWGFRLSLIYGSDYRYTTSYGLGSTQLLGQNLDNGFDVPMVYYDWYTPFVGKGLNIRVGRFISVPDIEAQLAPNNYMYSHSMTYTFDNYTNTGILATQGLTKNWIVQAGISIGTDTVFTHYNKTQPIPAGQNAQTTALYPGTTAPLDPGAVPSFTLCGRWNSDDGADDVNVCADAINGGQWGYNNLQWYGIVAYHKFNDKWHLSWELYNEHQNGVPNSQNLPSWTPMSVLTYNAPNFANCGNTTALTCKAEATGTTAYLNYSPNPLDNFSIRPEIYYDPQGQRTGTATTYRNLAFGWQHWYSPQVEIRPEIAYYHADAPAFNGNVNTGNTSNMKAEQTIISGDIIWHW
jgi:hypothetical protein